MQSRPIDRALKVDSSSPLFSVVESVRVLGTEMSAAPFDNQITSLREVLPATGAEVSINLLQSVLQSPLHRHSGTFYVPLNQRVEQPAQSNGVT